MSMVPFGPTLAQATVHSYCTQLLYSATVKMSSYARAVVTFVMPAGLRVYINDHALGLEAIKSLISSHDIRIPSATSSEEEGQQDAREERGTESTPQSSTTATVFMETEQGTESSDGTGAQPTEGRDAHSRHDMDTTAQSTAEARGTMPQDVREPDADSYEPHSNPIIERLIQQAAMESETHTQESDTDSSEARSIQAIQDILHRAEQARRTEWRAERARTRRGGTTTREDTAPIGTRARTADPQGGRRQQPRHSPVVRDNHLRPGVYIHAQQWAAQLRNPAGQRAESPTEPRPEVGTRRSRHTIQNLPQHQETYMRRRTRQRVEQESGYVKTARQIMASIAPQLVSSVQAFTADPPPTPQRIEETIKGLHIEDKLICGLNRTREIRAAFGMVGAYQFPDVQTEMVGRYPWPDLGWRVHPPQHVTSTGLTAERLAATPPGQQRQLLHAHLLPGVQENYPEQAMQITARLLRRDNEELLAMLRSEDLLLEKASEEYARMRQEVYKRGDNDQAYDSGRYSHYDKGTYEGQWSYGEKSDCLQRGQTGGTGSDGEDPNTGAGHAHPEESEEPEWVVQPGASAAIGPPPSPWSIGPPPSPWSATWDNSGRAAGKPEVSDKASSSQ